MWLRAVATVYAKSRSDRPPGEELPGWHDVVRYDCIYYVHGWLS